MKTLVIAPHAFYIDRGTPIDLDILLRALSTLGYTVEACVYHEGRERSYPGLTIHRIQPPSFLQQIGPGFSAKKLLADVYLFMLAWRRFRKLRPDIVHAGEEAVFFARFLKLIYGTPYVYDMDSSIAQQLVEKKPWLRPLAWFFDACESHSIKHALACAPVCHALADLAKVRGAKHIETLHDISQLADPDRPAVGMLHDKLKLPKGRPILMYVGNFERYQGVDLLLEGFAAARSTHNADIDLVLAGGSEPDITAYKQKAQALGITDRAHFLGRWPADKLDELLAEADILTAPRIMGINTPQKIFPYMHAGKAVLLTDLPTHTQIVSDAQVALAKPDPASFGQAIAQLAADPHKRAQLAAAGKAFVEHNHTFTAHQQRVERLYHHVQQQLAHP